MKEPEVRYFSEYTDDFEYNGQKATLHISR